MVDIMLAGENKDPKEYTATRKKKCGFPENRKCLLFSPLWVKSTFAECPDY